MTYTTTKRRLSGLLLLGPVLLTSALLAGCSDDSAAAGSGDKDASATPTDPAEKSLAFSQCMRDNGVENFPDPTDGGIRLTPESGVDMNSDAFRKAQEACRDLSPQADGAGPGGQLDAAKVAAWAECIRANGMKDFPDPEVNGGSMEIDMSKMATRPNGDAFQKAMDACRDKYPGGGVMMKGARP
ncbi:hypothetical protein AB0M28_35755 [Streptomyces sp. NPDC051940]|uniref:hypothetical protein n=1 Tax=Streptomyces sp. NPDC051940 TaxID=3155675 RepID=UPI00344A1E6F